MATQITRREAEAVAADAGREDGEARRKRLLAITDQLLGEIEELNLADRRRVPGILKHQIEHVFAVMRRGRPIPEFRTPTRAHDLVLNLLAPLLAANARNPQPFSHPRRPAGLPAIERLGGRTTWKRLVLPPQPAEGITPEWLELAFATVERAYDRWAWAQHHAVRAAMARRGARSAVRRAVAAWSNFFQLADDLDRLRGQP